MNGYGHTARLKHKINISRKRRPKPQISRQDLTSAIDQYFEAGGKITKVDDHGMSEVFTQDGDYNPVHYSTSKAEISGITNNREV